jgi:hypothetical protein
VRLVVEDYHSYARLAAKFDFSERSIRDWAAKGEFGPGDRFLRRGTDVRVPTSGVLFFIERNLARHDEARMLANKVRGRTLGEARRRLQAAAAIALGGIG